MEIPRYDPPRDTPRRVRLTDAERVAEAFATAPAKRRREIGHYDPNRPQGVKGRILQEVLDFINPLGYIAKKQRKNLQAQQRPRRRI